MISDLIKYTRDKSLSKNEFNKELDWVKNYYQSEGFKERLSKLPHYYNNWYLNELKNYTPQEYDNIDEFYYEMPEDPKFKRSMFQGSHYRPYTKTITIGLEPRKDYGRVAAHELGHHYSSRSFFKNVDGHKQYFNHYNYYPVFRENNEYKKAMEKMKTPADKHRFFTHPDSFYDEVHHDAQPGEGYADLIEFRSELAKHNIYDSMKAGNPFTLDHLNKVKESGIKSRLFDYYNDDQIVFMMNEVAMNNQPIKQNEFMAKHGGLLKRKFKEGSRINIFTENKGKNKFGTSSMFDKNKQDRFDKLGKQLDLLQNKRK